MLRFMGLSIAILLLAGCGQSGELYLSQAYKTKHASVQQPAAPSKSLQALKSDQHVIYDN